MVEPLLGIMFVRCCRCTAQLPSVPVDINDPANGMTSHGYCEVCQREFLCEYMQAESLDAAASESKGD